MSRSRRGDAWSGYATAWAATSTLLAGILVGAGIGWLLDRLLGTDPVFLAIWMVIGVAAGIYLVYLRYGREDPGG